MLGFYRAWEKEPDNQYVQHIIKEGFPPATMVDPRSPPDVLSHFAESGNTHNKKGSTASHLEAYIQSDDMAQAIEEEEKAYKASISASAATSTSEAKNKRSQAGDQTRWMSCILRRFPHSIVKKYLVYDHIRIVRRNWTKDDLWDRYAEYCNTQTVFWQRHELHYVIPHQPHIDTNVRCK